MTDWRANIQSRVESFFRGRSDLALKVSTRDCCSEMTRLVASWLQDDFPTSGFLVLKGTQLHRGSEQAHEVLGIESKTKIDVIDPTVWQLSPDENDIFVGEFESLSDAYQHLRNQYGGDWVINERFEKVSNEEAQHLQDTLYSIIAENA